MSRQAIHRNKVHHVHTIDWVAEKFGVTEDKIHDLTAGLDTEDGLIWVYGARGEDGVLAFTDDGIAEVQLILEETGRIASTT